MFDRARQRIADWIAPKTGVTRHYCYHSFPRRWRNHAECESRGLAVLASILQSGFLLTPERVQWPGEVMPGDAVVPEGPVSYNRRVCFTYLFPPELRTHATQFGPFSIELGDSDARALGVLPVIYMPVAGADVGLSGAGRAVVARFADFQDLLERLKAILASVELCPNKSLPYVADPDGRGGFWLGPADVSIPRLHFNREFLESVKTGNATFVIPEVSVRTPLGADTHSIMSLLRLLTWKIQSFDVQLGSVQGLSGFFYPTERDVHADELLTYYRQREWRIIDSMTKDGQRITRPVNPAERANLLDFDEFFARTISLRDGSEPHIVDQCSFLTEVGGRHVMSYARRVVCPTGAIRRATALLAEHGFSRLEVVPFERVHYLR